MGNTSFDVACRKGQFNDVKRFHYSEMRLFQVFSNPLENWSTNIIEEVVKVLFLKD